MSALQRLILMLRVLLEVGVVAALTYWGLHTGDDTTGKILLAVLAPGVGFGFWGAIDFRGASHGEILRLLQELAISGIAAAALLAAGDPALGLALAGLSIIYHALVYASGARLLKPRETLASSGGVSIAR